MQQRGPRIALWGLYDVDGYADCLDARIFDYELTRRLPHTRVDIFAPVARALPANALRAPSPLGRYTAMRQADFAERYDLVAVGGEVIHGRADEYERLYGPGTALDPSWFFIEGLGDELERRCAVAWHAVGVPFELDEEESQRVEDALDSKAYVSVRDELSLERLAATGSRQEVAVVPNTALLVRRVMSDEVLEKRLAYIRLLEWYPPRKPPLVVQGDDSLLPHVGAIAVALEQVRRREPIVLLDLCPAKGNRSFSKGLKEALGDEAYRLDELATVEDLAAAIGNAGAFLGSSAAGVSTALAFGVPALHLAPDRLSSVQVAKAVTTLVGQSEPAPKDELLARLDTHFDILAELAERSWRERLGERGDPTATAAAFGRALAEAEEHTDLLLRAYETRGARLVAERLRFAELADARAASAETGRTEELMLRNAELENQLQLLDAAEGAARSERDALAAEVERLHTELETRRRGESGA